MWKISPSTLHRASLSNPFGGFDAAKFARERLGPLFIDPSKRATRLPEGRSQDSYQAAIDQHHQPFNSPFRPGK
jgi:hypothetical protein